MMDNIKELYDKLIITLKEKVEDEIEGSDEAHLLLGNSVQMWITKMYHTIIKDDGTRKIEFQYKYTVEGYGNRNFSVKKDVKNLDNFENDIIWAYDIASSDKYD